MKRYVYVLCLFISLLGLISCSKSSDPAPASPVVGRWDLNRGLLSGFPSSTTVVSNGEAIDFYAYYSYGSRIDIYSDNTFNQNDRQGDVVDATGTWAYTNNTLTLTYDQGGQNTLTYSKNKNIEELAETTPENYTAAAGVVGKIQLIYRK